MKSLGLRAQFSLTLMKTLNYVRPRAIPNHRCDLEWHHPKEQPWDAQATPEGLRGSNPGLTRMSCLLLVTEGTVAGTHLHTPSPRPLGAPPLQRHVSCQNKPLGEGTAEAEASTEETPATNPNTRSEPLPALTTARFTHPSRASGRRR